MISEGEALSIAQGWVDEYLNASIPSQDRERKFFFILDDFIYQSPHDALRVFQSTFHIRMNNIAIEGFSAGPLRTFLMNYKNKYIYEMSELCSSNLQFKEMYLLAKDGLS